jgi:ferric-dicitrate binding protein FerR (iron transport regulator)
MDNPIENSAIFDLVVRVLSGEATSEEKERLQEWLNAHPENGQAFEEYKKTWEAMEKVRGVTSDDLDAEWQKLESRIDAAVIDDSSSSGLKTKSFAFYRVAAVILFFLVAAFAAYFYLDQRRGQEWVAVNEMRVIELPDGSKVTLNKDSRLAYSQDFNRDQRTVSLSGEAFFEVARNERKPFVIQASDVKIEVLGTSFNVLAYKRDDQVEVVVNTGKVAVYKEGSPKDKIVLRRGEKGVYARRSGSLTTTVNSDVNYLAWKTGKLIFEDTPLEEVVKTLNRVYRSRLVLMDSTMTSCPITSTFENQSLDVILEVLKATLNLETSERNGKIEIRGEGC